MFEVKNLCKLYDNKRGISDISFNVDNGEILGVIGENGSGKTTTFKSLLGLIDYDSGTITHNEEDIKGKEASLFGFLSEERSLYGDISVYRHLSLCGKLKKQNKEILADRMDFWLNRLNITEFTYEKINSLSKGNQQKVQLACCLLHDPEIIILDEPFTGLDAFNADMLKKIILELAETGKKIIISSHQFENIEDLFSTVLFLKEGKSILFDKTENLRCQTDIRYIELTDKEKRDYYLMDGVINQQVLNNTIRLEMENEKKARKLASLLLKDNRLLSVKIEKPTLKDILKKEI